MFRIIELLKLSYNLQVKTKENAIVDAIDYQIPVNQLERGRYRYTSSKASVPNISHFICV